MIGRVVQGHEMQPVPVQPSVAVHGAELVHPPWHCILTVNATFLSLGAPLNACLPMSRVLELYSTVNVCMFVSWNAFWSIIVQPEVRTPQSSENTYAGFAFPE